MKKFQHQLISFVEQQMSILELTQHLTEMSTRIISLGVKAAGG
jgi:hypothetical protein